MLILASSATRRALRYLLKPSPTGALDDLVRRSFICHRCQKIFKGVSDELFFVLPLRPVELRRRLGDDELSDTELALVADGGCYGCLQCS